MMKFLGKIKFLIAILLVVVPGAGLAYLTILNLEISNLASKITYFNAVFLAGISLWYSLIARTHDLNKYEVLSSLREDELRASIRATTNAIYTVIAINFLGILTCIVFWVASPVKFIEIQLAFLSIYFLYLSFVTFIFFPFVRERIESANNKLIKREQEEKNKLEILKSLKNDVEKFEKDPKFEKYNEVFKAN